MGREGQGNKNDHLFDTDTDSIFISYKFVHQNNFANEFKFLLLDFLDV